MRVPAAEGGLVVLRGPIVVVALAVAMELVLLGPLAKMQCSWVNLSLELASL